MSFSYSNNNNMNFGNEALLWKDFARNNFDKCNENGFKDQETYLACSDANGVDDDDADILDGCCAGVEPFFGDIDDLFDDEDEDITRQEGTITTIPTYTTTPVTIPTPMTSLPSATPNVDNDCASLLLPREVSLDDISLVSRRRTASSSSQQSTETPYDSLVRSTSNLYRQTSCSTTTRKSSVSSATGCKRMYDQLIMPTVSFGANFSFPYQQSLQISKLSTTVQGTSLSSFVLPINVTENQTTHYITSPIVSSSPLEQIQENYEFESKRAKIKNDVMHVACRDGDVNKIAQLLASNINATNVVVDAPVVLTSHKSVYDYVCNKFVVKPVNETYTYPLNLALQSKVDASTLELLIKAGPQVLLHPDGPQRECSIHVLLKNKCDDLQTLDSMLLRAPMCATQLDKHMNTALHVACNKGSSLTVLQHLVTIYPDAVFARNFYGLTPLQVAEKSHAVSDEAFSYLWQKMQEAQGLVGQVVEDLV